jgi:geranylgeranyl diphosphate synthase type I
VKAAAALELLHTFALVHDDVMDGTDERRGVEATHVRFAKAAPPGLDPDRHGTSVAILVGDLAAVLAEHRLRTCGASPGPLEEALRRFDRMRVEMAAGQFLDLGGLGTVTGHGLDPDADPNADPDADPDAARARVAALKTGSYTAEGPVLIGSALAEAGPAVEGPLRVYARLVGEAFQLRDDVLDGEADRAAAARVDDLVERAVAALEGAPLEEQGAAALSEIAELVRTMGSSS